MDMLQKIQGQIRTGLEVARKSLSVPILFGHLCKGDFEEPGGLRVSSVVGQESLPRALGVIKNHCDHETALLRHVLRFGREQTTLYWLIRWALRQIKNGNRSAEDPFFGAAFLVHDSGGPLKLQENSETTVRTSLSRALLETLAPKELASRYLKNLYQNSTPARRSDGHHPHCGKRIDELELLAAQLSALHAIKGDAASRNVIKELCAVYRPARETPVDSDYLRLLSALQTAFLYARIFQPSCVNEGGFILTCRPHRERFGDSSVLPSSVPVLAVSTSVEKAVAVDAAHKKLAAQIAGGHLCDALHGVANDDVGAAEPPGSLIAPKDTKFSSANAELLASSLPSNQPFKLWSTNAAKWLALLVSKLQVQKHEGGSLEFIFAMGDVEKIKDSPAFDPLLRLKNAKFEFPPPTSLTGDDAKKKSLESAERVIAKENYFWFQGGRHALLWDFTFPGKKPGYLLSLKDSSWHVFINNARNGMPITPAASDAALVVAYLDGRGGGGIIVQGTHVLSLSQEGKWIQRGEPLFKRVAAYLGAAGKGILSADETKKLATAIIAVSNDPDIGCMLVLAKSRRCPNFETMGRPWKVTLAHTSTATGDDLLNDLTHEKLVALLGMDGAACVWKDGNSCRIAFRKLARPPERKTGGKGGKTKNSSARPFFKGAKDALSGEGSRKWSAFLAASRKDVNLIVAVSQDGPVHFYTPLEYAKAAYDNKISTTTFKDATDNAEVIHDKVW